MKKDRNSFFTEQYQMNAYNNQPFMVQNEYAGYSNMNINEIDSRISKLERNVARLDARLRALETPQASTSNQTNLDSYYSNSMYMV